jgi:N-acetylglucosamine kinase-like BadF-type ATPase
VSGGPVSGGPVSGARPAGGGLPAVLAVDGGNSKTDAALVAADGSLLAAARGPGTAGAVRLDETLAVLAGLARRVQREAGLAGRPVARHLSGCMANADLPEEAERLAEAIRAQGWSETTDVANDTFAVLRAGLPLEGTAPDGPLWGVAVTCGAGINCMGVAPSGQTTGFLSFGDITGDWGGGYGLGKAALWWAMRAEDGRGPDTALRTAVAAHFRVQAVREVAIGIHLGTVAEDDLLGLAPVLLAAAGAGDRVARGLVDKQAAEICTMAVTAMRRLGLSGLATPVILGGGLLTARDPLLTAAIDRGLAERAPNAVMRIVEVPPVAGAALLGLDRVGAGPGAEQRLRAAYGHPAADVPEGSVQ